MVYENINSQNTLLYSNFMYILLNVFKLNVYLVVEWKNMVFVCFFFQKRNLAAILSMTQVLKLKKVRLKTTYWLNSCWGVHIQNK